MSSYILSRGANKDLEGIWDYIAEDNPEAAERWTIKLLDACEAIAQTPGMGHRRRDLTRYEVMFWAVDSYVVIYRVIPPNVEIVAVTQGSRDIPVFLHHRLSI